MFDKKHFKYANAAAKNGNKHYAPLEYKRRKLSLKQAFKEAQERIHPYLDKIDELTEQIKKNHPKTKINKNTLRSILILLAAGHSFTDAAYLSGISKPYLQQIRKEHPDFEAACDAARSIAVEYAIFCLFSHMRRDWRPAAWFLERARPETWGKIDQLKISGIPTEPIIVKFAKAMHEEIKHIQEQDPVNREILPEAEEAEAEEEES